MMLIREHAWSTIDEFRFIDGLGSHSNQGEMGRPSFSRDLLLQKYVAAMEARAVCGDIDKRMCIRHAMQILQSA